jgi:hypothetical protein
MNNAVNFEQVPPRSWEQFEVCTDVFSAEWGDTTMVRNGRAGQAQQVDIVGTQGALHPVGLQCKKKGLWPVTKLTKADIDTEIA